MELYIEIWLFYTMISFAFFIFITIKVFLNKSYTDKGVFKLLPFDEDEKIRIKEEKKTEPE